MITSKVVKIDDLDSAKSVQHVRAAGGYVFVRHAGYGDSYLSMEVSILYPTEIPFLHGISINVLTVRGFECHILNGN